MIKGNLIIVKIYFWVIFLNQGDKMSQDSQGLLEKLKELAEKIAKDKANIKNEAQTRTGFVNPFLKALDYKLDDIRIIVPEYDVGDNKDKKVDYAILRNGKPLVLIEIKHHQEDLNKHTNQLKNYFALCADCNFAILTNGLEYRFFSNTEKLRTMDSEPFMVLNLESTPLESSLTSEKLAILDLFKQAKLSSKIATIRTNAKAMLEKNAQNAICATIKVFLEKEMSKPSNEFVGFVIDKKFNGTKKTAQKIKEFRDYITRACREMIVDIALAQSAQSQDSQDTSKELNEE